MTLTIDGFNRAFDTADSVGPGEPLAKFLVGLGIDAELFEWLYRTVAGPEGKDEDRMATYTLGVVTTLLAVRDGRADMIQRMPVAGERWSSLSDEDLSYIMLALESDADHWRDQEARDHATMLWRDADAEMTRRGLQPEDRDVP
jgi:hypothetical protein